MAPSRWKAIRFEKQKSNLRVKWIIYHILAIESSMRIRITFESFKENEKSLL